MWWTQKGKVPLIHLTPTQFFLISVFEPQGPLKIAGLTNVTGQHNFKMYLIGQTFHLERLIYKVPGVPWSLASVRTPSFSNVIKNALPGF